MYLFDSMKTIVILATVLAAVLAYPADTYNPRYDNFDAEELVSNKRVLESYGKCFLDKGPCTAEGNDFKSKFAFIILLLTYGTH